MTKSDKLQIIIRPIEEADRPVVISLWEEFIDYHKKREIEFNLVDEASKVYSSYLNEILKKQDNCLLVAEVEGNIAGYILGGILKTTGFFKHDKIGRITEIFVREDYRKNSIADSLLEEIIEWFRERGILRIETDYYIKNKGAELLWKKTGFVPERTFLVYDRS